jgi:hypothetical protein
MTDFLDKVEPHIGPIQNLEFSRTARSTSRSRATSSNTYQGRFDVDFERPAGEVETGAL